MTIVLIVIKASLLLAAALLGARALRRAPAAARHALWSVTFAALLALPLLAGALPSLHVPVPDGWAAPAGSDAAGAQTLTPGPGRQTPGLTPERAETSAAGPDTRRARADVEPTAGIRRRTAPGDLSLGTVVRLVWLVGALGAACALGVSLMRVRWLKQTAVDVTDGPWRNATEVLGARLALRRPTRVLMSDAVRTPMAGGVWEPIIFVPRSAASWSGEQRDVVLAHELSHIARRDPLRHLATRAAMACYWFHPLAWLAARQASLAREQACDEAVIAMGVRPSAYARVLLDLAETMAPAALAPAALPMVERSLLETRLMAILEPGIRPRRLRQSLIPAGGAAVLAIVLAAAQPAARGIAIKKPDAPPQRATPALVAIDAATPPGAVPSAAGQRSRGTGCWSEADDGNFSGFSNTDERGVIRERVGSIGGLQVIQQRFGGVRLCMAAEGAAAERGDRPSAWVERAPRVLIETAQGTSTASLEIRRQGGAAQTTWRVNGAERPPDAAAQTWRDAVLAVLDQTWEISTLRGQESSLRGDISSLRGEESSLRGDISSLRGEISSLRGEQSSIRGEESSLRGEISTIEGHLSSLRGQLSSERGSISSLEGSRYGSSAADRDRLAADIKEHEKEIERIERLIRDYDVTSKLAAVEKQIRALNADGKVADIEEQIRRFNEDGKTAAIQKQIEALNVEGRTAEIERRITALDVERRTRQLESRLDDAVKKLQQAVAAIR
jgi:beta-lactamase regulating signal transducer with metallopeptidase domain/predicted  nucleic acid-binding Zn-ribbon protein